MFRATSHSLPAFSRTAHHHMHPHRLILLLLVTFIFSAHAAAGPVTPKGEALIKTLDAMHVQEHWIAGAIVDWRTGDPTGQPVTNTSKHTHCSQFAAAVCDRLGIYLLHPPEHSSVLLANAQFDWLPGDKGTKNGWSPVPDAITAQDMANEGRIVVAVYKNHDPAKSGHIAIIRPCDKPSSQIIEEGPQVTQAGGTNYNSGTLKQGFRNHPEAFKNKEIKFYSHHAKLPAP